MNKNKKIIIGILIMVLIIVIGIVVAYKLIEKSVTNREDFKFNVENISSNPVATENFDENEYSFFGKVIESNEKRIIVEPNENEEIRKSADKISIGLGEYNDALYMVGANVKITYDGTIMESYPAQVKATKIELKSAENIEYKILGTYNAERPYGTEAFTYVFSENSVIFASDTYNDGTYEIEENNIIITYSVTHSPVDGSPMDFVRQAEELTIEDENTLVNSSGTKFYKTSDKTTFE